MFLLVEDIYKKVGYSNNKYFNVKGATKVQVKIIFMTRTKIGENTARIWNCHFS